jgi:hypothetical protein
MILGDFILHSKEVLGVVSYDCNNLMGPHKEGHDRIQCELTRIRRPFETATVFSTGRQRCTGGSLGCPLLMVVAAARSMERVRNSWRRGTSEFVWSCIVELICHGVQIPI